VTLLCTTAQVRKHTFWTAAITANSGVGQHISFSCLFIGGL